MRWLEALGAGTAWEAALTEALGLDVDGLGLRLRRWLEETTAS